MLVANQDSDNIVVQDRTPDLDRTSAPRSIAHMFEVRAAYGRHYALALSIISFQMPFDLRISSTASRIAPWPARAFVV